MAEINEMEIRGEKNEGKRQKKKDANFCGDAGAAHDYGRDSYVAYWEEANGVSRYFRDNSSCYREVLRQIDSGKPCIISLYNKDTKANHYVTVVGYVNGATDANVTLYHFIAIDPIYGEPIYLGNMNYSNTSHPHLVKF